MVRGRPRPITRKRGRWFISYGRRKVKVYRRGSRRYIRLNGRIIYLNWSFRIRFKGVRRLVRCRRKMWKMRIGRKWRRIRRRWKAFIKRGGRRYPIRRRGRKYFIRRRKRWMGLLVRRRRKRGKRGPRRKLQLVGFLS